MLPFARLELEREKRSGRVAKVEEMATLVERQKQETHRLQHQVQLLLSEEPHGASCHDVSLLLWRLCLATVSPIVCYCRTAVECARGADCSERVCCHGARAQLAHPDCAHWRAASDQRSPRRGVAFVLCARAWWSASTPPLFRCSNDLTKERSI